MNLSRRAARIATCLSPLFLISAVLLSFNLANGLALTTGGFCIAVRVDPATGQLVEIPKLLDLAFIMLSLAAVVPAPILWTVVLLGRWRDKHSHSETIVRS